MTDKWLAILNDDSDRLVARGPGRRFSMAQLRQSINSLQSVIAKKKYPKWVLYDDDGFQFICAMFALLTSGREVLIPPNRNKATIESLLDSDTGFIGSHPELQKHIDVHIDVSGAQNEKVKDSEVDACVTSTGNWGRVAFCTSGSSGKPKVITKSTEQLYLEVESFNLKWHPTENTLFFPLVTHLHIYGLTFAFLLPLLARAAFYLPRNGGLLGVVEPITLDSIYPIDELVVVTSPTIGRQSEQIRVLAEHNSVAKDDRPARISRVFCAGGKLTSANADKIIELFGCPVTEIFGSTETGAVATREHNKQQPLSHGNLWHLLPGLDAMIVKKGAETGLDLAGEFSVWGGHVGGSREQPVVTGDEVNFFDHHRFELLGRSNQICKIEGKRVSLNHLAEILEACELVVEATVMPVESNHKEVLLCGVVLSQKGNSFYREFGKFAADLSIREYLLRFLDPVLVPRNIRYLDQMPGNEMGKLTQQELGELLINPVLPELPLIEKVKITQEELVFSLRIPMELLFLRGHFENKPIVPGVVLLHWVYCLIGEYWKLSINPAIVNRLKFTKPATPGDQLTLIIRRLEDGVDFVYQSEQKTKFSSGKIPLKSEAKDV